MRARATLLCVTKTSTPAPYPCLSCCCCCSHCCTRHFLQPPAGTISITCTSPCSTLAWPAADAADAAVPNITFKGGGTTRQHQPHLLIPLDNSCSAVLVQLLLPLPVLLLLLQLLTLLHPTMPAAATASPAHPPPGQLLLLLTLLYRI
jgi:hypothetical protein